VSGVESCTIVFLGGYFLFTCSDTFALGCMMYRLLSDYAHRQRERERERDGRTHIRTDNIMMPIADPTACSTIC